MNKLNIAAISAALAVGSLGGAGVMSVVSAQPANTLQVANMRLIRNTVRDGGVEWYVRSCARELMVDGGTANEPCWGVTVPTSAATSALEAAVLAGKP